MAGGDIHLPREVGIPVWHLRHGAATFTATYLLWASSPGLLAIRFVTHTHSRLVVTSTPDRWLRGARTRALGEPRACSGSSALPLAGNLVVGGLAALACCILMLS